MFLNSQEHPAPLSNHLLNQFKCIPTTSPLTNFAPSLMITFSTQHQLRKRAKSLSNSKMATTTVPSGTRSFVSLSKTDRLSLLRRFKQRAFLSQTSTTPTRQPTYSLTAGSLTGRLYWVLEAGLSCSA